MSLLEKIKITNFKTIPLIKNNGQSNFNTNTLKSISNKKQLKANIFNSLKILES